jgi:hypothetical protein
MNTKKNWTKSIAFSLLVALASLATTGLVLADHYPPVGDVAVSSQTYYLQYQAELDHMERDRNAAVATSLNKTNISSHYAFSPGSIAALKQLERDHEAASLLNVTNVRRLNALAQGYEARIQLNRTSIRRLGALVQGYNARKQLELDRSTEFERYPVSLSGDSWFLVEHFTEFGS